MEEAEKGHAMGRNIVGKANRGGASREWVITDQKKKDGGRMRPEKIGMNRNPACMLLERK